MVGRQTLLFCWFYFYNYRPYTTRVSGKIFEGWCIGVEYYYSSWYTRVAVFNFLRIKSSKLCILPVEWKHADWATPMDSCCSKERENSSKIVFSILSLFVISVRPFISNWDTTSTTSNDEVIVVAGAMMKIERMANKHSTMFPSTFFLTAMPLLH